MTRNVFVDHSALEHLTMGDLLRRYAEEISPTKKSRETEQCRIKALLRDPIAQTTLSELTSRRIAIWRDQRLSDSAISGDDCFGSVAGILPADRAGCPPGKVPTD